MCNLSQGIVEKTTEKFVMSMYNKGYTVEQISDVVDLTKDEIEKIIKKSEPVMA